MPESHPTHAPEQAPDFLEEQFRTAESEAIINDSMKDHSGSHEHPEHVHDACCGHSPESAGQVADNLFAEGRQSSHDHSHEGPHVCTASCSHGHQEATSLADELFDHDSEADHHHHGHHHDKSHAESASASKAHEHHDHDCSTTCQASSVEADHHAHELFDEPTGHGPECTHCQQSAEQANDSADRLFAEQQVISAESEQQQMIRMRREAVLSAEIAQSETATPTAVDLENSVNKEPIRVADSKTLAVELPKTVVTSPVGEELVSVTESTGESTSDIQIEEDTKTVNAVKSEKTEGDTEDLMPVARLHYESENSVQPTAEQFDHAEQINDFTAEAEIVFTRDYDSSSHEPEVTNVPEAISLVQTVDHSNEFQTTNDEVSPTIAQRLQPIQASIEQIAETFDTSSDEQEVMVVLQPIVYELMALMPLAAESSEASNQVEQLVEQIKILCKNQGIEMVDLIKSVEVNLANSENAQLLYEILDGRRRWQSIEHSSEFNGSHFTQALATQPLDDPRMLGQYMLAAFGRFMKSIA